ncbi:MAG: hypothetical protein AABY15_05670 [Nanoarchaeota archaeon]
MMEIQIDYYILSGDKRMGDGQQIPKDQKLILILKDDLDGMLFFETHNDEHKKLFWTNQEEVEFIETVVENWDEEKINERNRYINGEFL